MLLYKSMMKYHNSLQVLTSSCGMTFDSPVTCFSCSMSGSAGVSGRLKTQNKTMLECLQDRVACGSGYPLDTNYPLHRISFTFIHWIAIYLVDSTIQASCNRPQMTM